MGYMNLLVAHAVPSRVSGIDVSRDRISCEKKIQVPTVHAVYNRYNTYSIPSHMARTSFPFHYGSSPDCPCRKERQRHLHYSQLGARAKKMKRRTKKANPQIGRHAHPCRAVLLCVTLPRVLCGLNAGYVTWGPRDVDRADLQGFYPFWEEGQP